MTRGKFLVHVCRVPFKPDAPIATLRLGAVSLICHQSTAKIADLVGFKVFRNTANDPGSAVEIGFQACRSDESGATFYDVGAVAGVRYFYWVQAVDSNGNQSGFSRVAILTPLTKVMNDKVDPSSISQFP